MAFPSLPLFLTELKTVTEWYIFGIHIGLDQHVLDQIRQLPQQEVSACLAKVYGTYKDCYGPPSWEIIVEALKRMDKLALAEDIKKKYLVEESDTMSTAACTGGNSTIPTLKELLNILSDKVDWYVLGVQLDIPTGALDSMKEENDTVQRRLIAMLQKWLKLYPRRGWHDIVDALEKMNENAVANEVAINYC